MFNDPKNRIRLAAIGGAAAAITCAVAILSNSPSSRAQSAAPASTAVPKSTLAGAAATNRPLLLRNALPPAPVQWSPAVSLSDRIQSVAKPGSLITRLPRPQLDAIRLPVILPRSTGPIRSAAVKLISFGDAYSMNLPQDEDPLHKGTQITVYGTRTFVPADQGALSVRPITRVTGMAEDVRITQMEDGWTASFTRFGVVYSIDVTCDQIKSSDCQNDGYIRKAIADFADVAVGAQARSEAKLALKPAATTSPGLVSTLSKNLNTLLKPATTKP